MTTNKQLRELAEKAGSGDWYSEGRYLAAARPETILALLDENEAVQAELARELQRRFDGNEQASREHREDVKALVEALVKALVAAQKEAVRGISHARNGAQAAAALSRVSAICGAAIAAPQAGKPC